MHPTVDLLNAIEHAAARAPADVFDSILSVCRRVTGADAGTIYRIQPSAGGSDLWPASVQNVSVALDPETRRMPADPSSIAAHVAATGDTLVIDDAYAIDPGCAYRFDPAIDEAPGFRTGAVACIPLLRPDGSLTGVVQLVARGDGDAPRRFAREQIEVIAAAGIVISGVIERTAMLERLEARNAELEDRARRLEALHEETIATLDAAEHSNAAKSAFLACIGHELRTPLNAIIGFSELMEYEKFGPLGHPSYGEFIREVSAGGRNLLAVLNDILAIVQADSGADLKRETVHSIHGCIEDTGRSFFELAAEANVVMAIDLDDGLAFTGNLDTLRLQTALERLIDNAIKFTRAGGEILVTTAADADGSLRIEVRDTGIGMSREEIERALRPFGQVDTSHARSHGGAGLGLTLASVLVRGMGGLFDVDSGPDAGTTVSMTFPARPAQPAGSAGSDTDAESPRRRMAG